MRAKTEAMKQGRNEEAKQVRKDVRRNLRKDRINRLAQIADQIEDHMKRKDVMGAHDILRHWYNKFTGRAPKPLIVKSDETKQIYDHLFQKVQLLDGEELEFPYDGTVVCDQIPTEEEIIVALYCMRN